MIKISVVVISYNEEQDIGRCLESVLDIADEVLVLDSYSTDGTESICRQYPVRFEQHVFDGYVAQKNRAVQMATYDHILSLDADEALSPEAKNELLRVLKEWSHDGYIFNRRNSYCGHWMRYTNWYPDRKLRLFDRRKAEWTGLDPHDSIRLHPGATSTRLNGDILHWAIHTRQEQLNKTEQFARISAQFYFEQGIRPGLFAAFRHSVWRWFREYCIHLGFLDGKAGWQVARFSALYVWRKYYYLRQLYENQE